MSKSKCTCSPVVVIFRDGKKEKHHFVGCPHAVTQTKHEYINSVSQHLRGTAEAFWMLFEKIRIDSLRECAEKAGHAPKKRKARKVK